MNLNELNINESGEDRNKDSPNRWQQITITQMGYIINLIIVLAMGSMVFSVNIFFNNKFTLLYWFEKMFFYSSLLLQLVSLIFGILIVLNRLKDFRITFQIARQRNEKCEEKDLVKKDEYNKELRIKRNVSQKLGEKTWVLFNIQIISFGVGMLFFTVFFIFQIGR